MDSSNALTSCIRYTSDSNDKSHPRSVTLVKDKSGFGFTLRHFIVYPPTSLNHGKKKQGANEDTSVATTQWKSDYKNKPMDTIFIREVKEGSPAHNAGLNKGDRIIAINNHPLSGKTYSDIIHLILKSGQTLRLLVVPKEDDILQLYFASSAYQPVHREHKQHKYLVPSYCPDSEQSNQQYRQSSYGTYPGRIHKKSKGTIDKDVESKRGIQHVFLESDDVNKDLNLSSPSHLSCGLEDKDYDLPSPAKCIYEGSCFSEDEGLFHHAKDFENEDILELQPPKLKSTVANLYYSLCRDQPPSNFAFASEENLNYPIYMSDFDDIVHCDNMAESKSISEALHGTGETISSHPISMSYPCDRPQYGENNHSCDRIRDSAHLSLLNEQKPSYYSNNKMINSEDLNLHYNPDTSSNNSSAMHRKTGERNSIASDYDFSENPNIPSINIVAQRRHQFESGNLLAESMERMNLYRSELSRMSMPNHVRLVSSRTAEFETKTGSSVNSLYAQKSIEVSKKNEESSESHMKYNDNRIQSFDYDSTLDHQNSNKTPTDDSLIVADSPETTVTAHSDINPAVTGVVHRRKTVPVSSDQDECHIVRRISYLRATANDRMNIESDLSEEDETSDPSSPNKEFRIQKLKSFFGEKTPKVKQALVPVDVTDTNGCSNQETTEEPKSIYGWVICKVVSLEGKRSSDRSWRHVWAILRENILYLLKERREPSKGTITGDEHVINVKYSIANVANDYVKRKHVLRLMLLNGTEYLFQTESHASMMEWLKALKIFTREISELPDWLKNTSVLEKAAAYEQQIQKGKSSGQHHNVRKLVFRHRSPSEHSPSVKTRRASQDELALTKIGVLWRDRMVQGWKKVHGTNSHIPKGASFGVKLENAPPGVTNEHIPLIVELCIQIVESRGLDTVGIYRVPGNNASVSVLTDLVNQGIDDELIKDPRWNDVNIVSSLLKAYFRKLPEPLLTSYLYPKFIQASETEDPVKRLKAIKHVLYHLPVHYFATLRYLMYHLKKVVEHSATNKMEARNLAIVFGPTLVRTTDNNMVAMVTDMPQQCYLIETMITYAEWLFEDCGDILPVEINAQDKRKTHPPSTVQSSALLSNINKLDEESLPHEMFASFCNAASRHLRHRQKKKDPASYSKKRSGIIADDADILGNPNDCSIPSNFTTPEIIDPKIADSENLSDISFGSCSSLISGSTKSKQRSTSKEPEPQNGTLVADRQSSESSQETSSTFPIPEEEQVGHRYNKLSALAQEKIKNFEQETKALLRRDGQRPRTSVCAPQVEWEQIEKEWQKAKLELEQEDLLDYLADDPSYLSCLLGRSMESTELSPPTEFAAAESFRSKSGIPLSSSSSAVTEISHSPNIRSPNFSVPTLSESQFQNDKFTLRDEKISNQQASDPLRTKLDKSDIPTSVSQPILSSVLCDRTSGSAFEEYSLDSVKCKPMCIINASHSESTESKNESRTRPVEKDGSEEASACSSDATQPQTLS
ncbi:rho GTPase-activating protein 21-like isoform X2 [Argiope bruennichi]|uniref:rho GTPase-activating protein 21-like isoform X2 n=1 Tax=Argiope bruennichi TaxID=94029 RepID=UPI00249567E4|nr:rho GTPase-activating protein 21-like isoform X2 [Argiope bruennichi]